MRFAHLGGSVIAIKETSEHVARHEYHMLRKLARLDVPCVEPVAVITGRTTLDGRPLNPVLVTRHLKFSMPYRALFSQMLRKDTLTRLIDAQALLMVRLHLIGFYWGDVSLSNTLFRRDAGRLRRVPGGRRDRRAVPGPVHRAARVRSRNRPGQHRR